MNMPQLHVMPCPFCGGYPKIEPTKYDTSKVSSYTLIHHCDKWISEPLLMSTIRMIAKDKAALVKYWNRVNEK